MYGFQPLVDGYKLKVESQREGELPKDQHGHVAWHSLFNNEITALNKTRKPVEASRP